MSTSETLHPDVRPVDEVPGEGGGPAFANVVVPLSGSAASEAAVGPAAELALRFGAGVHLLTVGIEQAEADAMAEHLATLAAGIPAVVDTRVDWDVPGSILDLAAELEPAVVCMASHARGRLGELFLGSHTAPLLARTPRPVVLVGPGHDPERGLADGPVLACVDGSTSSEQVVPVAARWASALGAGLHIVTVAERTLAGLDDRPAWRSHGPRGDAEAYVDALADRWRRPGLDVSGLVVYDPIDAARGLATLLDRSPGAMVALATHARTGLRRAVLGSQAASILRHSPVPVLVVPPDHR